MRDPGEVADVERLRRLAAPIATAAGIALPVLRLSRVAAGAECRRTGPGRYVIVVPASRARDDGDDALRAMLAHELAHAEYGDPRPEGPRTRAKVWSIAIVAGVVITAVVSLAGLVIRRAVADLGQLSAPLLSLAAMTVVVGLVPLTAGELVRRSGRTRKVELHLQELRADLRAVQLVGHDAVRQWRAAAAARPVSRTARWLDEVIGTHPAPAIRLAAVDGYDPADDPDTAARTALAGVQAPRHAGH